MKKTVISFVVLAVMLCSVNVQALTVTWGANLWQPSTFKITGVTSLANGEVAFSGVQNGRGVIIEATYNTTQITGTTSTGFDAAVAPDDLAYLGSVGGGDQYYLGRYTSGRGRIEQWNTVTGWGTEVTNYSSYVLGLDTTSAGAGKVVAGLSKTAQLHEFGVGMTSITSSGTSYFHGAASLGDINADGNEDYVFCSGPGPVGTEASFASYLWFAQSTSATTWATSLLGPTSTVTTFSGIENVGDVDGDGFMELMLTRFSRTDVNYSWVDLVETDIVAIPEPATLVILGVGGVLGLLRKKW